MRRPAVILVLVLLAASARAIPPERAIQLAPGAAHFEKAPRGSWRAVSSDPEVVEARYFDTAEVFLQAKKPGEALVLLANLELGQVWVWKVRVAESREVSLPDPGELGKQCACGPGDLTYPLTCRVENAECLKSLRQFLQDADLTVDQVNVRYSVEGLQDLLQQLNAGLKARGHRGIGLSFLGANLRITGQLPDRQAWHRLILDIYREMVGKLVIDNRVELEKEAAQTQQAKTRRNQTPPEKGD